jgi:hypothetical protein
MSATGTGLPPRPNSIENRRDISVSSRGRRQRVLLRVWASAPHTYTTCCYVRAALPWAAAPHHPYHLTTINNTLPPPNTESIPTGILRAGLPARRQTLRPPRRRLGGLCPKAAIPAALGRPCEAAQQAAKTPGGTDYSPGGLSPPGVPPPSSTCPSPAGDDSYAVPGPGPAAATSSEVCAPATTSPPPAHPTAPAPHTAELSGRTRPPGRRGIEERRTCE